MDWEGLASTASESIAQGLPLRVDSEAVVPEARAVAPMVHLGVRVVWVVVVAVAVEAAVVKMVVHSPSPRRNQDTIDAHSCGGCTIQRSRQTRPMERTCAIAAALWHDPPNNRPPPACCAFCSSRRERDRMFHNTHTHTSRRLTFGADSFILVDLETLARGSPPPGLSICL